MKPRLTVSIVIPTFNRAPLVVNAIQSALSQSHSPLEVIVVDDGSTDNTSSVLERYRSDHRVRLARHATNEGPSAAKNTGLRLVQGDWVGILDSDDELLPGALQSLVACVTRLREQATLGTVIGNCISNLDGSLTGQGVESDGFLEYEDLLCGRVHGGFWGIFSRELLGARLFDDSLRGFERALWLEFYKHSVTYYSHKPVYLYRRGLPDQLTDISRMMEQAEWVAHSYRKFLEAYGSDLVHSCPRRLAYYLRREGFFEVLSGDRIRGLRRVVRSLRLDPTLEGVGLLALGITLPRSVLARAGRKFARTPR
jgi:glycosyltransferase involved in cell wall biosynthesis